MVQKRYVLQIFTDYNQFLVQDENAIFDYSANIWTDSTIADMVAVTPGIIYVGTARPMSVPVAVEIHDSEPRESLDRWDHVTECGIELRSGTLVIIGTTDYFPKAKRITVKPTIYRARIFYSKLGSISEDGLDGDDNYKISVWPGSYVEPVVIKRKAIQTLGA